jgi:hypothetical protein
VISRRKRTADSHRIASWMNDVNLRLASATDRAALERLAMRDDRSLPPSPHLVAARDGELAVALSLVTGEIVADPFQRTVELQALLRCYAAGARVEPGAELAREEIARTGSGPWPSAAPLGAVS